MSDEERGAKGRAPGYPVYYDDLISVEEAIP